ncbi:MAG: copper homeostasis protein CutC [Flavobacteriales bacterium]|nr:copper homeostasis protein CutC [Flavobacteriales bacterium]
MIFEVCIDSYEGALLAKEHEVKRVELCSALSVGGLTPSIALAKKCSEIEGLEVHAMVRSLEGNFVYSDAVIELLKQDIESLAAVGISGVVFGCLSPNHEIDIPSNKALLDFSKNMNLEVTFHRAFDYVPNPITSLEQIIQLGFDRILTSGTKPRAIEGIETIIQLVKTANGRIQIMAGSGVSSDHAIDLASTGIDALHFTSHQFVSQTDELGMGKRSIPDPQKIESIIQLFK